MHNWLCCTEIKCYGVKVAIKQEANVYLQDLIKYIRL